CWEGEHRILALVVMICFGYYLPLSTMNAPMFVESESSSEEEKKSKKDFHEAKPWLSFLACSKCFILLIGNFYTSDNAKALSLTSLFLSFILFCYTVDWFTSPRYYRDMRHIQPCQPLGLYTWQVLTFVWGVWGSFYALIIYETISKENWILQGDQKFM